MINSLIPPNWNKLLIQGKLNSGKSEFTLWILNELINQNMIALDHLLDNKDGVLFLTEKIDQISLINHKLLDKIHVVENISSKDSLQVLKSYHENYNIQILVIDYINLLDYQSHKMSGIMSYIRENSIKAIFIQNTFKLIKPDLAISNQVDYVIETSRGSYGIEAVIKSGRNTVATFWLDTKMRSKSQYDR